MCCTPTRVYSIIHGLLVINIERLSSSSASAIKVITLLVSNQLQLLFGVLLLHLSAADIAIPVSTSPALYVTLSYSAVLTRASLRSSSPARLIQSTLYTLFLQANYNSVHLVSSLDISRPSFVTLQKGTCSYS